MVPFVPLKKREDQGLKEDERRGMMNGVGFRLESFTG